MVIQPRVVGISVALVAAAAAVFAFDPARVGIFPTCPLHQMTGLWCPGCGSTRAFHQLLHGNLIAAFRFNPLAILMLPLAGYLVIRGDVSTLKPAGIWALLIAIVMFGVLRNIPVYPFTLLAP